MPAVQRAQRKEGSIAPYAIKGLVADPFLSADLHQFVEYRARQACLQPIAHQNVGVGGAALGIVDDTQRMGRVRRHSIVNIGAETQHLIMAFAAPRHLDCDERGILDSDPPALHRRYQPEGAVRLAPQNRAEQSHKRQARDGRATIGPGAVAGYGDVKVATINGLATRRRRRRRDVLGQALESL
jgi:hypothetical protein